MDEVEREEHKYSIVSKRLVYAWVFSTFVLVILQLASFQYTNYVDRRSNHRWCGIVNLFNGTYEDTPPTTPIGQKLANEFIRLQKGFSCPK